MKKKDKKSKEKEQLKLLNAERIEAVKKASKKLIWGESAEAFNTVGSTARCCTFYRMQVLRLFMLVAILLN